jgi:hypothetical protein
MHTPTSSVRRSVVLALAGVLLARVRRAVVSVTIAAVALIALDVAKNGVEIESILAWTLGGAVMLPLAPALSLVREKADGSLRFFAWLPVEGAEHVLARGAVAIILSLPAAIVGGLTASVMLAGVSPALALSMGVGTCVVLSTASFVMTAFQLRAPIGRGPATAAVSLLVMIAVMRLLTAVLDESDLSRFIAFVVTPAGMALVTTLGWGLVGLSATFAARVIGMESQRYSGEVAQP